MKRVSGEIATSRNAQGQQHEQRYPHSGRERIEHYTPGGASVEFLIHDDGGVTIAVGDEDGEDFASVQIGYAQASRVLRGVVAAQTMIRDEWDEEGPF